MSKIEHLSRTRTVSGLALVILIACALAPRVGAQDPTQVQVSTRALETSPPADRARRSEELLAACAVLERELAAPDVTADVAKSGWRALAAAWSAAAEAGVDRDLDARVTLFERARSAARQGGQSEAQARAGLLAAQALIEAGRAGSALDLLVRTRTDAPRAKKTLPFVLRAEAEAERQLGRLAEALANLDAAERARPEGDAWAALDWRIAGARGSVWLDLGLLDQASACFARERQLLEAARGADHGDQIAARLHAISLDLAAANHRGVIEGAERLAAEDPIVADHPRWRASLAGSVARSTAQLARRDPSQSDAARTALTAAVGAPALHARERAALFIRLAELEARVGADEAARVALEAAQAELAGGFESAPEHVELDTLRARLARIRHAPRTVLAEHGARLAAHLEREAAAWAALPMRGGGHGWLEPGRRRGLLAEHLLLADELHGADVAAANWLELERATALVRLLGAESANLTALRREFLVDGQGVLVWCPGPEHGAVIALDREGATVAALDAEVILQRALSRRLEQGANESEPHLLADVLLPPTIRERVAKWSSATRVGLDVLGRVPADLLPATMPVDSLPSLTLGLHLARGAAREASLDHELALVTATRPSRHARALVGPLDDFELDDDVRARLVASVDPKRVLVLAGDRATSAAFRALPLETTRVLAYLGHGGTDTTRERPAVLVLADEPDPAADAPANRAAGSALIGCDEVEALKAPVAVILACCRGARGPARIGEGQPANLAGAWLAAGARCVVLAHDDLSLTAATELTAALLADFARGVPAAEAVRRAQAAHPKGELAGVEVVGLGQRPFDPIAARARAESSSSADSRRFPMWAAIALLITAGGVAVLVARGSRRRASAI